MLARILSVVVLALALVPLGRGEEKQLGNAEMTSDFNKTYTRRMELVNGTKQPVFEDQKVMDLMSRWYIYRVTWAAMKTNPEDMEKVHIEYERDVVNIAT